MYHLFTIMFLSGVKSVLANQSTKLASQRDCRYFVNNDVNGSYKLCFENTCAGGGLGHLQELVESCSDEVLTEEPSGDTYNNVDSWGSTSKCGWHCYCSTDYSFFKSIGISEQDAGSVAECINDGLKSHENDGVNVLLILLGVSAGLFVTYHLVKYLANLDWSCFSLGRRRDVADAGEDIPLVARTA